MTTLVQGLLALFGLILVSVWAISLALIYRLGREHGRREKR